MKKKNRFLPRHVAALKSDALMGAAEGAVGV